MTGHSCPTLLQCCEQTITFSNAECLLLSAFCTICVVPADTVILWQQQTPYIMMYASQYMKIISAFLHLRAFQYFSWWNLPSLSSICVCGSFILMTVTTALFTWELPPWWVCFPYPRRLTSALRIALPPEGRPLEVERWEVEVIKNHCELCFHFPHTGCITSRAGMITK